MGAVLLPVLLSVASSALSSVFAPQQPGPVVIKPGEVSPDLSQKAAADIAKTAQQKGEAFGSMMLNGILDKARKQGLQDKDLGAIKDQFNTWFGTNQGEINKTMDILAQHSQDQANYTNQVNENNFQTQLAATQAAMPQKGGFGGIAGSLLSGLGGGFGGGAATPTLTDSNLFSGGSTGASAGFFG